MLLRNLNVDVWRNKTAYWRKMKSFIEYSIPCLDAAVGVLTSFQSWNKLKIKVEFFVVNYSSYSGVNYMKPITCYDVTSRMNNIWYKNKLNEFCIFLRNVQANNDKSSGQKCI
jgi:hypothetical protein